MRPRTYYHMSENFYEVGETLIPTHKDIDYLGAKIGLILESNRPENYASRLTAIYLNQSDDFTGQGIEKNGYIYKVKPIGNVSCHHNFWLGVLQKRHSDKYGQKNNPITDVKKLTDDQIAKNYWNEIEGSVGKWEHLVVSLEILERLTDEPVTPSHNKPLNKTIREILG